MGGFFYYPEENYQNKRERETKEYKITVVNGNITVPDEVRKMLGIKNRADLRAVDHKDRIELFPNIHSLSKVYIEPTTLCNLTCQTCVRNTWNEPMVEMSLDIFDKLVEQLKDFQELKTVMYDFLSVQ